MDRSLVFTKPGNEHHSLEVFSYLNHRLEGHFVRSPLVYVPHISRQIIEAHYENIRELPIFEATIEAYLKDSITLSVYCGEDIISRIRKIVGITDPRKAEKDTIRGRFSSDSMDEAFRERRYLNNVIHASSGREDAEREIKLWMPFLNRTI